MTSWMLAEATRDHNAPHSARIESVGMALPSHRVTTAELMATTRHHTKIELEKLTGIHEHRACGPGETSLSLALAAARDALARSHYTGSDLDMVVDASITRYVDETQHRFEPPLSATIKHEIGADHAQSFDIANACAGMLTGVFVLNDFIRRGIIQRGIVVSGERITGLGTNAARSVRSILSPQLASLTLGDAGAAVIVERAPADHQGIGLAGFTTLAEHSRLCLGLPALHHPGAVMFTRARKIHEVAMQDGPPLIEDALARAGLHIGEVDWMIPHQTSVRAIHSGEKAIDEQLGEHPKHMVVTVDEYGNTASTTLFLALHRYLDDHRIVAGEKVMLLSVASGLEVGVVVFVMDELEGTHGRVH